MTGNRHSNTTVLYYTPEFDCPYIESRIANNTVLNPNITPDRPLYSQLLQRGFRRNGSLLYRPNCNGCQQCIATRIDSRRFQPNRSQLRCMRKNEDLTIHFAYDLHKAEYKDLYNAYIQFRHSETESMHDCEDTFTNFLSAHWSDTTLIEFRLASEELLCLAIIDEVEDGWSDIYTIYHPEHRSRGLGVYSILWQIRYLRDSGKRYLYLGYYVPECKKMAYKAQFQPLQYLIGQQWVNHDKKQRP